MKKHTCQHNSSKIKGTCSTCSKVKIAILTKNNCENRVWFSFYKYNHLAFNEIVLKMWDKIKKDQRFTAMQHNVNRVIAYERDGINKIILQ